jgi:hypothetical protein
MKKILIITYCFGFFLSLSANAQNKNTYWLHGLGDTESAWQHYATIFEAERQMNSSRPRYYSTQGVESSTTRLSGLITPNPQNIGIGHSMGGTVLRNLDRVSSPSSRRINGLITVASPNSGAGIANSFDDQSLLKASQKACSDLSAGPASELFAKPWKIVELKFASSIGASLTTKALCELLITNQTIEQFAGSSTARSDLKMGSSLLSQIDAYNSTIPRLTMIAEENSPVHWRMLSSTITRGRPNPSDQLLPDVMTGVEAAYNAFYWGNTAAAVSNAILGFINPVFFAKAVLNGYQATQWKKGVDWLKDSETIWNGLTKSSRLEPEKYWVWTWIPCETIPGKQLDIDDIGKDRDQSCGEWGFVERTRQVMVHYPSDGFIPSYSQDIASLPASNRYYIRGANHIEVLNMSNSKLNGQPNDATKDQFNDVFDNRTDIFRTDKR